MKVELWRDSRGEIRRFEIGAPSPRLNSYLFLGYEEINMTEQPKKTVVKEAEEYGSGSLYPDDIRIIRYVVPPNAKNIKHPTYEIEE